MTDFNLKEDSTITPENYTIFDSLSIFPFEEHVIAEGAIETIFESLGYELVDDDDEKSHEFLDALRRQVPLYQDQEFPRQIGSSAVRSDIEEGKTQILTKNKKSYVAYSFDDEMTIIFESGEVDFFGVDKTEVKGFKVENIILRGNGGNAVDLMSLRRGRKVPTMFTFMEIKNTYSTVDDYVAMCMPTKKLRNELLAGEWSIPIAWDSSHFKHLFLHEHGHVTLHEYEIQHGITAPATERNTNALLLHTVRELKKRHPRADFYNEGEAKNWAENQLVKGYEPNYPLSRNLHEYPVQHLNEIFNAAASQRRRGQVRNALIEKKNEDLNAD